MEKLIGSEIQKSKHLFEDFDFYQSIIFSIFENQFDGAVYIDSLDEMNWALLQTPFLQHIIAGKPTKDCEGIIEKILFSDILQEQVEKELVVFHNNNHWNVLLKNIFEKRKGVSDLRKNIQFFFRQFL